MAKDYLLLKDERSNEIKRAYTDIACVVITDNKLEVTFRDGVAYSFTCTLTKFIEECPLTDLLFQTNRRYAVNMAYLSGLTGYGLTHNPQERTFTFSIGTQIKTIKYAEKNQVFLKEALGFVKKKNKISQIDSLDDTI